ncbi:P1-P2 fusion [Maize yellow dwarf virus RMV]|uniref:p1-P2 fusion n=1 Tax=Maize yellow dwarf virus RMV TaxID=2170101 RepID=R9U1R7_9VIRU|nr:P1-P2 fusion [Maize yellow dwarf virus RMV]AGN49061.1 P1-P2 fusion [Maize yellow dwarf virus RMV]
MLKLWCALLLLFCLSCSVNSHSLGSSLVRYTPPLRSMRYVPPAEYLLPWNSSSMVTRQNTCIEISYTALSREILQLAYRDLTRISSVAINASNSGWKVFAEELSSLVTHLHQNISRSFHGLRGLAVDGVQALAGGFLLAVIYTWSYLISLLFWVVTTLVCRYTFQMSSIACLYVCTMLLVRLASKIFGGWPVMIISLIGTLTSKLFRALSFKKSSISFEIPTPGYKTVEIPQKPPKDCVLLVQHNDALNSPGGYASCVRLLNGSNALLTAKHVSTQEGDLLIASSRTGNRIKLSLFNTILTTKNSDVGLYQGPPGWESILGCKAADIVPVDGLSCCEASIYRHDGNWMRSNASLVGTEGTFVSVLSNTIEGFSGTPYFNGKSILGVHVGGNETRTNNLMAPIPSIPGLTKHKYVFESPQLRGRLFTDEEVEKLEFEIDEAFQKAHNLIHFKSKTGRNWADDEDDIHFEAPKFQGKRRTRSRPRKQNGLSHPYTLARRYFRQRHSQQGGGSVGLEDRRLSNRADGCSKDLGISFETPNEQQSETQAKAQNFSAYFASLYRWEVRGARSQIPGFEACGSLPKYYFTKQKEESEWGRLLAEGNPALASKVSGFGWPQFGPEAELKSLRLQAQRWLSRAEFAKIPSSEDRERVIRKTVEAYKTCQTQCPKTSQSNLLVWEDFLEDFKQAVFSLEPDAGVGVPFVGYDRRTHRGWIEDPTLLPVLARMTFDRLHKMSTVKFEQLTAEQLVQQGLCDPIRLFVKGEPHKQSKLDEGRYRLIMSVSLLDQLVARVLFQNQNKREIALWRAIPSKPGFGLSTDAQSREFVQNLAKQCGVNTTELLANWPTYTVPTDCSGFDWSVADWMLQDDMEVRNRLTRNNTDLTKRLRACWLKCISNSVLCLSDGTLLAQRIAGIQKSGSYNTSSSNSRIRVMAAYHCGATWAMAMGDDALESVDTNLDVYKTLGFKVEVSKQLEFCSHIFEKEDLARPVNQNKMIYKLLHGYNPANGSSEVIQRYLDACMSVLNELRHDPETVELLYQWLVAPVQKQKV